MALHIIPEDSLNLGHHNFKNYGETPPTGILAKMEKCKNLVSVYETFKNLLLQNCSTKVQMMAPPTLLAKKIAKDDLNIANLMQTFENLLLQKYSQIYCTQITLGYV